MDLMPFLTDISTTTIILTTIGGLGIFLYGLHLLGESLKDIAGTKLKLIIEKTTSTPLRGIITGTLFTVLIQSSSGVTVIVISLISAGLMKLPQAVAVIVGANIGTTVTAILIGLPISKYALALVALGALICFFIKRRKVYLVGSALLGFGFLFFGLNLMGETLKTLAEGPLFSDFMIKLAQNPFYGVLTGTAITAIIQSSSASIGILQRIYLNGDIALTGAIPILYGCNIGTTITIVIAALGSARNAKRAALAHVLFNLVGVILFLIILNPFTKLIISAEANIQFFQKSPAETIALAHVIFNLTTALLIFFVIKASVRFIEKLIPYTREEALVRSIDLLQPTLIGTAPTLALESVHNVLLDMCEIVERMYALAKHYLNNDNHKCFDEVQIYETTIDTYDNKLHDYLIRFISESLGEKEVKLQALYLDTISDLERIADHSVNLVEFMRARYENNVDFYPESLVNVNHLAQLIETMIHDAYLALKTNDKNAARRIRAMEPQIDELEKKYRHQQLALITNGLVGGQDIHFVDILANLERIGDHTNNIADNILFESMHDVKGFKTSDDI